MDRTHRASSASFLRSLLLLLAVALVAGCEGSAAGTYCDAVCECSDCSSDAYDQCVDQLEVDRGNAANHGCAEEHDDYVNCFAKALTCGDSQLEMGTYCPSDRHDFEFCMEGR